VTLDLTTYRELEDRVPLFLKSLKLGEQAGRYLPCKRGATNEGREMGLGWSCFAMKTLHMLGRWELLEREEREYWVEFIQDYQRTDGDGFFEDPPEIAYLRKPPTLSARLLGLIGKGPYRADPQSILLAETKQAIATQTVSRIPAETRAGAELAGIAGLVAPLGSGRAERGHGRFYKDASTRIYAENRCR
jgi:hypothetical protein